MEQLVLWLDIHTKPVWCPLQYYINNIEKCFHFGWTKNNGASYGASQHYGAVGAVGAVIGNSF